MARGKFSRFPSRNTKRYVSILKQEDVDRMNNAGLLPAGFKFFLVEEGRTADHPSARGELLVYKIWFDFGFRYPPPSLVREVCLSLNMPPSELLPHAHKTMVAFCVLCILLRIECSLDLFFQLYTPYAPGNDEYWMSLRPVRPLYKVLDGLESSLGSYNWKNEFLLIKREGEGEFDFGFPTEWRDYGVGNLRSRGELSSSARFLVEHFSNNPASVNALTSPRYLVRSRVWGRKNIPFCIFAHCFELELYFELFSLLQNQVWRQLICLGLYWTMKPSRHFVLLPVSLPLPARRLRRLRGKGRGSRVVLTRNDAGLRRSYAKLLGRQKVVFPAMGTWEELKEDPPGGIKEEVREA